MYRLPKWFVRHHATFIRYAHTIEAWSLLAIMVGGGFGAGYLTSQVQLRPALVQRDSEHNAEISRLQAVYQSTLLTLGDRNLANTNLAMEAIDLNLANTNLAKEAIVDAKTAAKEMTAAVRASEQKQRVTIIRSEPDEAIRDSVNRSVDKANRSINSKRNP